MSSELKVAPYGTWASPITADLVSGGSVHFTEVHTHPTNGTIYLVEGRPAEKGRCTIVELRGTEAVDILPSEYNTTSKIHEYGGGACVVSPDGSIIFTDANTNGVFRLSSGSVKSVRQGSPTKRFGDFNVHPLDTNWILAVHEEHRGDEVVNCIVVINDETQNTDFVAEGADFYSHPRFSPDGKRICWTQWNHPDMPWTGTELYVADWNDGNVVKGTLKKIAGELRKESICQPRWNSDGSLVYSSDRNDFWLLYRLDPETSDVEYLKVDGFEDSDFGGRQIFLGDSTYIALTETTWVLVYTRNATNGILVYNIQTKTFKELPLGLVDIQKNCVSRVSDTKFAVIGATSTSPAGIYLVDITKPSEKVLLKSSSNIELPASVLSESKHITFPRTHGETPGSAHVIFVPPKNLDFEAPPASKPPLIVSIHGGPTSHKAPGLSLETQYFTSRGYAYCSVNYGGSTGYGRKYRESLDSKWGILDVDDAASCVSYLASEGLIDGKKVGIVGGSAGGYTVLQSLIVYPDLWAGGVSLFGVGNMKALAAMTHKFEAHYLFDLMFPQGTPEKEQEKIYWERSPCFHADKIKKPLLMLQGSEDKVVPMAQSEEMERVMKKNGADVKLVIFEGEGHGFKRRENIKRSIEEEEELWKRTLLG